IFFTYYYMSKSANLQVLRTTKKSRSEPSERLLFKLMGLPSATLAWYKQPSAMWVGIFFSAIFVRDILKLFKNIFK
ncbi:hypothetical protein DW017_02780, partial [Ruminococcus sp. AF37-3AC]